MREPATNRALEGAPTRNVASKAISAAHCTIEGKGTQTGLAIRHKDGQIISDSEIFKQQRFECGGMRYCVEADGGACRLTLESNP